MYNDKVCEISEVPKLLDRSLDCQYTPLGHTDLPRWFKQDNLCRAILLDNFLGDLFIYLILAKPALPGQFVLLVSSQSKEKS